jgi:hypothetical protein
LVFIREIDGGSGSLQPPTGVGVGEGAGVGPGVGVGAGVAFGVGVATGIFGIGTFRIGADVGVFVGSVGSSSVMLWQPARTTVAAKP